MIENFRPPTDNLYKFIALSGLAILLACGWAHLRVDIEVMKLDRDANSLIQRMVRDHASHMAEQFDTAAIDTRAGIIHNSETLQERVDQIFASSYPNEDSQNNELAELGWKRGTLLRNNTPERTFLKCGIGFGFVVAIFGFVLWYRRVQRPLDKILDSQYRQATTEPESQQTTFPITRSAG